MKNVYVVCAPDYESTNIIEIFANRESAEKLISMMEDYNETRPHIDCDSSDEDWALSIDWVENHPGGPVAAEVYGMRKYQIWEYPLIED